MKRIPNDKIVAYQVYLKSFKDTSNIGHGTLKGVTESLWYFKYLGVNLIWLTPFLESPMNDNGYDVSSFYKVNKDFGTMRDLKELLKKAREKNIMVICDFVLNHTSNEHPFFKKALKNKNSKYRDYYYFLEGKKNSKGKLIPPTNWMGFFSTPSWTKVEGEKNYYMHIFSNKMPDLNFTNKKLRKEIVKFGTFWAKKGFMGFRVDAVSHLAKAPFEDIDREKTKTPDFLLYSNLPKVHDYLKELNKNLFSKYNLFTVGEVGGAATTKDAAKYSYKNRKELDLVFNFDHTWSFKKDGSVDLVNLKKIFKRWQDAFTGENMIPINWLNHDQNRLASRYGVKGKHHLESLKSLAVMRYFMRGVPFIYQGEELGLLDVKFDSILEVDDIAAKNYYNLLIEKGESKEEAMKQINTDTRDQSRTPLPWNCEENAGFSKNKPWLKLTEENKNLNIKVQMEDGNSLLNFYKELFSLRSNSEYTDVFQKGEFKFINFEDEKLVSYERNYNDKKIIVLSNYSNSTYNLEYKYDDYNILINTHNNIITEKDKISLLPYQSIAIIKKASVN